MLTCVHPFVSHDDSHHARCARSPVARQAAERAEAPAPAEAAAEEEVDFEADEPEEVCPSPSPQVCFPLRRRRNHTPAGLIRVLSLKVANHATIWMHRP